MSHKMKQYNQHLLHRSVVHESCNAAQKDREALTKSVRSDPRPRQCNSATYIMYGRSVRLEGSTINARISGRVGLTVRVLQSTGADSSFFTKHTRSFVLCIF